VQIIEKSISMAMKRTGYRHTGTTKGDNVAMQFKKARNITVRGNINPRPERPKRPNKGRKDRE